MLTTTLEPLVAISKIIAAHKSSRETAFGKWKFLDKDLIDLTLNNSFSVNPYNMKLRIICTAKVSKLICGIFYLIF